MALLHLDFFSNVLGQCVQADVILPQQTTGQIGMEGVAEASFPTLYLLHGHSDDHTIWQRRTSIERYAADKNLAVVMPTTQLGWYTDTAYGLRYQTYLTRELPAVCRSFFKGMSERREDTFVAGLSMGGYGAFKAALSAPETFGAAASLSGALDLPTFLQRQPPQTRPFWDGIFGNSLAVTDTPHDLLWLARGCLASGAEVPRLFQWCGTEDALYPDNVTIRDELLALGLALTYTEGPGAHSWGCWDEQIQKVLAWLLAPRPNGHEGEKA